MAAKSLPGWSGAIGVDFSGYPIPGTNCANCRSLVAGKPPHCKSERFIESEIEEAPKKAAGDDEIPVRSGNPSDYCCNFWGMRESASKKNRTRAWAEKVARR